MSARLRALVRQVERTARRAANRTGPTWRYGVNLGPTWHWRGERRGADTGDGEDGVTASVLADLDRDGIAVTHLDTLVGAAAASALLDAAREVRLDRAAVVDAARSRLVGEDDGAQKPYVVEVLGGAPPDPSGPLGRFALDPAVLAVVHGYFGMHVRWRYQDIWHTFVTDQAPSQSQLWHRDPEDRLILKVFVALEEVDAGAGPFHYAPGTHAKGRVRRRPDATTVDGRTPRSDDAQMARVVPEDRWVQAVGPVGTVVFADTRGFHKGGHATERERVLLVTQYLSLGAGRGGVATGPRP